jgi:uncharacterized protein YneF (UPF0154 family)
MFERLTVKERLQALKPGQIIWPLVIILVLLGTIVGTYNYQKTMNATKTPEVAVSSPADNQIIVTSTTKVSGTVDKGSKVVVGNKEVAVDKNGNFNYEHPLNSGLNTITLVVTGKNGKSAITTRRVTYNVPKPVATTNSQVVAGKLSDSGPDNFWIPEAALVAAAAVGYFMTKKELQKAQRRI